MKKKIVILAAVAAMALTSGLIINASIDEAKAGNPECPNGCKADGKGCVCNGYHRYLKEAGNLTGFEES